MTGSPAVDLSVVVLSYQTRDLLRECLEALDPATGGLPGPAELVVVDNGSTDGSRELVRTRFPGVALIEPARNLGFAGANNLGLQRSCGRFVLLLNADARVMPGAVGEMLRFLERRPDVGLVGPRLVYPDGRDQDCAFALPTLPMAFLDVFPLHHHLPGARFTARLNGRHRVAGRREPFPIGHPLGACMLVRRAAFEAAGLLDAGYFMYAEEIDWCIRLRRAGWGIYCVPTAVVVHHGGASTGQPRHRAAMLVELYRSRYRLFRRHYSGRYRFAARLIFRLGHRWAILGLRRAAGRRPLTEVERARLRAYRTVLALR